MIYTIVLVSSVQQSDSVIHTHIQRFFFQTFSLIGYYKIISIVHIHTYRDFFFQTFFLIGYYQIMSIVLHAK